MKKLIDLNSLTIFKNKIISLLSKKVNNVSNNDQPLNIWRGSVDDYNNLESIDYNTIYVIELPMREE